MGILSRLVPGPLRRGSSRPSEEWLAKNTILIGGERVPLRLTEFDTIVSGGKGTGKTTALSAQLVSHIDCLLAAGRPFNVHAYTPKPDDFYPLLKGLYEPLGISVRATNPFLIDSWSWDGSMDLTDPPKIDELAVSAIKDDGRDNNPYFKRAAQLVLRGVIQSLATTHPRLWTKRYVVQCLKDPRLLVPVLARCEETEHLVSLLGADQGVAAANLWATLLAELKGLELVASLIDETTDDRRFSIVEAANEPGIIWVWGTDPRYSSTIDPWNAVQFELLGHELLIRGDIGIDTLLYIDEFPQLVGGGGQKLAIIKKLLEFGRSSRVRSTLAIQTPAQIDAIFGKDESDVTLSQCHNAVVCRHSDERGQTYWSRRFGRERGVEKKRSFTSQEGGGRGGRNWSRSTSTNFERFDLDRVSPSDIGDLPVGTYEFGIFGLASVPLSRHLDPVTRIPQPIKWRFCLTSEWIALYVPKVGSFQPYKRSLKPPSSYTLAPLEPWECDFLGLGKPKTP